MFVLCGVWHGANWTFVLWGVWHGAFLVIERLGLKRRLRPAAGRDPLALCLSRRHRRLGAVPLRRPRDAGDYFASLVGLNGVGDVSFDMHDALNDRAISTLVIGCALAALPRFRLRLAAPR